MKKLAFILTLSIFTLYSYLPASGISENELLTSRTTLKSKGINIIDLEARDLGSNLAELRFTYKSRGYKVPGIAYLFDGKYLFIGPLFKLPSGEPLTGDLGEPEILLEKVSFDKKGLPYRGKDGGIEIIEFLDMECPYCLKQEPVIDQLIEKYNVKLYVAPFPLPNHRGAMEKHAISMCAEEIKKGSFWKFKELFMKERRSLLPTSEGLDNCIPGMVEKIKSWVSAAKEIGVYGTPSFIIDGYLFHGYKDIKFFSDYLEGGIDKVRPDGSKGCR